MHVPRVHAPPCVCPLCVFALSCVMSHLCICPFVCMFLSTIVVGFQTPRETCWCGRSMGYFGGGGNCMPRSRQVAKVITGGEDKGKNNTS